MPTREGRRNRGRACAAAMFVVLVLAIVSVAVATPGDRGPSAAATGVLQATLPNGLRVVVVRDPLAPVVTTEVNYLVGAEEAPPDFPGIAHAEEHMMFRGSPGLSGIQLADVSARLGGNFDADTQPTVTQYVFTVPAEDLDVALHIEAVRMRGVLNDDQEWTRERGAIQQEVDQDLSNPQYVAYTKLLAALFAGTPYANDGLGTRASFDRTTGAMLRKFHDTWYAPNNAVLVIAGDVEPRAALRQVEALFGGIPARPLPKRPTVQLAPVKPETLRLKTDSPYGIAMIAFRMPGFASPDYPAARVLADALGSRRGDLYGLAAEGKALAAQFSLHALPGAGLGYAVVAFPQGADPGALVDQVKKILASAAAHGLPGDLVDAARRREVADVQFEKNSVAGLADAWSRAVAIEGRRSLEDDTRAIERVTAADVNRVARQSLELAHAVVTILTPEASGAAVATKGFGGKESFAPKQTAPVTLPEWAEKALERLALPPSSVRPTVTTLPNGLRLIVQPETVSDTVVVYGHVENKPELEIPKGQEGVDEILEQLFDFGTTSLARLPFQRALDQIAAQESAGSDFSLQVLAEHFERGMALLADNELRPALPEPAFRIVRDQLAQSLPGRLQSPDYLVRRAMRRALFPPNDPTLRQPTVPNVSRLTLDDVRGYYRRVFRPDLTTIVVIGKITPAQAEAAVRKNFGAWSAEGPKPETLLPPVPLNRPASSAVPNASRVQDRVLLAETLGLTRSNPDYYALELGNHVLGGAFYATRLYRDLRESTGLVYYVDSSFDVRRTRSLYVLEYGSRPDAVSRVRGIVQRDLLDMQARPVTDGELQQAKALLLREIPLSEASVDHIARGLLSRAVERLPLDEPTRAAARYLELTAEQVRAAFARWLRPADLVQVTEGPTPK